MKYWRMRMTEQYKKAVYEALFYYDKNWPVDTHNMFFWGTLIHYKDFIKAKRGSL